MSLEQNDRLNRIPAESISSLKCLGYFFGTKKIACCFLTYQHVWSLGQRNHHSPCSNSRILLDSVGMHLWNRVVPSNTNHCSRPHCTSVRRLLCFSSPTLKYLLFILETQKLDYTHHIPHDLLTRCNDQPEEKSFNKHLMRQTFFWLFILISYFSTQNNHLQFFSQRNLSYNLHTIAKHHSPTWSEL